MLTSSLSLVVQPVSPGPGWDYQTAPDIPWWHNLWPRVTSVLWWPFCCSRYFRAGSFILQRHSSWINSTNHRSKVTRLGPVLVILTLLLKRDIIILIYTPCHRTQGPYLWIRKYSVNIRLQWLICFSSIYGHLTNVLTQHRGLMLPKNVYFKQKCWPLLATKLGRTGDRCVGEF